MVCIDWNLLPRIAINMLVVFGSLDIVIWISYVHFYLRHAARDPDSVNFSGIGCSMLFALLHRYNGEYRLRLVFDLDIVLDNSKSYSHANAQRHFFTNGSTSSKSFTIFLILMLHTSSTIYCLCSIQKQVEKA